MGREKSIFTSFLLATVIAVAPVSVSADPCSNAGSGWVTLTEARACDLAVASSPAVNNKDMLLGTINTIRAVYPAYAYSDYVVDSGAPYYISVDMLRELDTLQTSVEANDGASGIAPKTLARGFHDLLASKFVSLHDAHTLYIKPACFGWQAFVPLLLSSKVVKSPGGTERQVVYLEKVLTQLAPHYKDTIDPTFDSSAWEALVGREVTKIGGVDAVKHVEAMDNFISKDPGPRFNANLAKVTFPNMVIDPFPAEDTVNFEIATDDAGGVAQMSLPWAAIHSHRGFNTLSDLVSICASQRDTVSASAAVRSKRTADTAGTRAASHLSSEMIRYNSGSGGKAAQEAKNGNNGDASKSSKKNTDDVGQNGSATAAVAAANAAAGNPADTAGVRPAVLDRLEGDIANVLGAAGGGRHISRTSILDMLEADRAKIIAAMPKATDDNDEAATLKSKAGADPAVGDRIVGSGGVGALSGKVLFKGTFMAVIGLDETATGYAYCVARVPGFMPDVSHCEQGDDACQTAAVSKMGKDIYDGVQAFSTSGCARIAFDVVGNGGGLVQAGYALSAQVIRTFSAYCDGRYDVKQSDWVAEFTQFATRMGVDGFSLSSYLDPATNKPFETFDDFWNGPELTRGGIKGKYTKRSLLPCDSSLDIDGPPTVYYPSSRIAIITDGTCGSTCELFLQKMQNVGNVRVGSIGGIWPQPMDGSSFGGGNVLDTANLFQIFDLLAPHGLDRSSMPPAFPTSAGMTFDYREMYSFRHPDTVLEWGFFPSAARIPAWKVQDPTAEAGFLYDNAMDVWAAAIDGGLWDTTDNACEELTAVPCTDASLGKYQWCEGGVLREKPVKCAEKAPPPPEDRNGPSSSNTDGGDGTPAKSSSSSGKTTSVVLGVLMGMFAIATIVLAVMLIKRSPSSSASLDQPLAGVAPYVPPSS